MPGFARAYGLQRIKDTIASLFNRKLKLLIRQKLPSSTYDLGIDLVAGETTHFFKPYCRFFVGPKSEQGGSWIFDFTPRVPLRYSGEPYAIYYLSFLSNLFQKNSPLLFQRNSPYIKQKKLMFIYQV